MTIEQAVEAIMKRAHACSGTAVFVDSVVLGDILRPLVETERTACAETLINMIIGGRAWTEGQANAAEVLQAGADAILARGKA